MLNMHHSDVRAAVSLRVAETVRRRLKCDSNEGSCFMTRHRFTVSVEIIPRIRRHSVKFCGFFLLSLDFTGSVSHSGRVIQVTCVTLYIILCTHVLQFYRV